MQVQVQEDEKEGEEDKEEEGVEKGSMQSVSGQDSENLRGKKVHAQKWRQSRSQRATPYSLERSEAYQMQHLASSPIPHEATLSAKGFPRSQPTSGHAPKRSDLFGACPEMKEEPGCSF